MNEPTYSFIDIVNMIKSQDALTYEDGYELLMPIVRNYVPELIELVSESSDGYTRGKFIELLGETKDRRAVPTLIRELKNADQNVRQWAVTSLEKVGGLHARCKVFQYKLQHRNEFT